MNAKNLALGLTAAGLSAALGVGFSAAELSWSSNSHAAPPPAVVSPAVAPAAWAGAQLLGFSWIVDKYGPAVVNISVIGDARADAAQQTPQLSPDAPFYDFFKRFGQAIPRQPMPMRARVQASL